MWSEYKKTKAELRKHMRDLRKQHDKLCNKTLEQLEVKDPKGYYRSLKAFSGQEKSNQCIAVLGKWKQVFQQLGKPQLADDPRFDKEFYRESHALVALWTQVQTAGPDELDASSQWKRSTKQSSC